MPYILSATPIVPSLTGAKGLYHLLAADNGYPGVFHARLGLRLFTSDLEVDYPLVGGGIGSGAWDTYAGGDFDFAFGMAVTNWLELNLRGRYKGDAIECDDLPILNRAMRPRDWFYQGWQNRASVDRGDTDFGIKLILTKFLRTPTDLALYPYFSIPTGAERDTTLYTASYFGKQFKGRKASEWKYGIGADVLFFDFFDPFIEFWGAKRSLLGDDPFGDRPPAYITLGMKFIGTGVSGDICVDFLVLGKRKYEFVDFAQYPEDHVTTGWGARPTWAINLGFGYSYDFYRMSPVTNKAVVTGKIADKTTKKGIDAIISATGAPRIVSDPLTGVYEAKVDAGKIRVVVSKESYEGDSKIVYVSRGERVIVDFELKPEVAKSMVTGKVIDRWSTKPINKAEVIFSKKQEEVEGMKRTTEITTKAVEGEVYTLNSATGKWEKEVKPLEEGDITKIINGELHRLNFTTGIWEKVKRPTKTEEEEIPITQVIDGELYKLDIASGVWEKVKHPSELKKGVKKADTLTITNNEGLYLLESVPPGTHLINVKKEGYISQVSPVVCKPGETSVLNFELFAEKIILRGVHFEFDKATLLVDSYPILEKVYSFLKDNPDIRVEIGGHTDWIASDEYNLELSQRRANAVRNYLIMHGISPERLTSKGYGESMPIANNTTEEGRALNRRIELKILKK